MAENKYLYKGKMKSTNSRKRLFLRACFLCLVILIIGTPTIFVEYVRFEEKRTPSFSREFPVTVDPRTKTITDDIKVEAYLQSNASPLQASASVAFSKLGDLFSLLLASLSNIVAEHGLALASQDRIVVITPGARKEEVAAGFARTLGWSAEEKKEFLNADEGFLFPEVYIVEKEASPVDVKNVIEKKFKENIVSRYGTIEEIIPLTTTLTIASLIQKETIGTRDMRLVSGVIWNRIFAGQKLQLDATLQYVKASKVQNGLWWPRVLSKDKFIESPYNTYKYHGLPPTPIANPSVAAVVAALNPLKTDCFYYFHDDSGDIHCSADYETHEALIEQLLK